MSDVPFHDLISNAAEGDFIDGGWIPPEKRTTAQNDIDSAIKSSIPQLDILGPQTAVDKLVLWDFSKKVNGGKHFTTFFQQTGSCVGNGGGQAIWYLSAMDNARLGKNIIPKTPFYLLPYGRSRFYGGMRGEGVGSFGSTFAKAVMQDGILPFDAANLPPMTDQGGLTWGKEVEYTWSDGARISEAWLNQSRSFLVKSAAKCNSTKDVWDALANGYPCTIASSWGGQMRPSVQGGSVPVLLNRRVTTWQHQMCIIGIWNHPTLGRIFLVLNSWGVNAHGTPPDDAPPGSFWVLESEIDYIVRQDETFAFSQFVGFPSQRPNHWLI